MSETVRVLVASKNETLKRNMEEWFIQSINAGKLVIDFASSIADAEELLSNFNYDKVFHNGIYIIPAIEQLQAGTDVYMVGKTNNNFGNRIENINNKKLFSQVFTKKYLKMGANIGAVVGSVITALILVGTVIAFSVYARSDIDTNATSINQNTAAIEEVKVEVDKVGDVAKENNTILRIVYGSELNKSLPKKNNTSTIGDNND